MDEELTPEAKATAQVEVERIIAERVAQRVWSRQLLAWARDPTMQGTVPNEAFLAGVLVELCERLNALENPSESIIVATIKAGMAERGMPLG